MPILNMYECVPVSTVYVDKPRDPKALPRERYGETSSDKETDVANIVDRCSIACVRCTQFLQS